MGELAALSTVIGGALSSLVLYLSSRYANRRIAAETEKLRAETGTGLQEGFARTAALLAESARAELAAVREEVERVRRERAGLQHDVDRLVRHVDDLGAIMRKAGLEVPPLPPREMPEMRARG